MVYVFKPSQLMVSFNPTYDMHASDIAVLTPPSVLTCHPRAISLAGGAHVIARLAFQAGFLGGMAP